MPIEPSNWKSYYKKPIDWLKEKKILKGFRIGYKVLWNLFLIFLSISVIFGCFAGGVAAGYFASLVKDQPVLSYETMKKDIEDYSENTTVYFADNEVLGKLKTDLIRTDVSLDKVSPYFIDALLSTEDELFYEHNGVVPKAVFRATLQELTNQPVITGGSTITQQLVKNQILTNEVSFKRKAREILLSLRLERFFKKKEILKDYINIVPFGRNSAGQNVAGIEAASKGVFGVSADQLNIPQAAFLAGLPKNPFVYTPFLNAGGLKDNIDAGVNRAHIVLKRMLDAGTITQAQYDKALTYDYKKHFAKESDPIISQYPYLMTEVSKRASKVLAITEANKEGYDGEKIAKANDTLNKLIYLTQLQKGTKDEIAVKESVKRQGLDYDTLKKESDLFSEFLDNAEKQLDRDGYKIHTTINKEIYDKMQEAADKYQGYEDDKVINLTNPQTGEKEVLRLPMEVGAMLIDNKTGKIISFVGGRKDKYKFSEVNHATQTERQNGSTMKPLLDYGPAIENGIISPGTVLADLPTTYPGGKDGGYTPNNYGTTDSGRYHGFETARVALKLSHNVPAIQVYWMNKQHFQPLDYLNKMGFSNLVYPDKGPLPVAIGGLTLGVSVEENTNAYATFANDGKFVDAFMIDKIETNDGKVVYKHHSKPVKVFTPQTSYLVVDMLRDVIHSGTAADVPGRLKFHADWYGKTGTTQDWHDSWFVAANPNVTLGIWTGFDRQAIYQNGRMIKSIELNHHTYHQHTSALWASFANAAYDVKPKLMAPAKRFDMPGGIVKRTFCGLTMGPVTDACKKAGFVTTDLFNEKFLPKGDSKSDNAFDNGSYVILNDKKVPALPTTPKEFTLQGILLSDDFVKTHMPYLDMTKIKPEVAGSLIPVSSYQADNNPPAGVGNVKLNGTQLSWSKSASEDVIGYRVYRSTDGKTFEKIQDVVGATTISVTVPDGPAIYYVKSVDITGLESIPSNQAQIAPSEPANTNPDGGNTDTPPGDNTDGGTGTGDGTQPPAN
jgi:penicillin-binding protein 1B